MFMRKFVLLLMVWGSTLVAQAEDYPYLTFEMTDGSKVSVSVESLKLSFSETTLTAGSQTFTISNLSKMYFTATSETTTGVESIDNLSIDRMLSKDDDIYDLSGKLVLRGTSSKGKLTRGVYIIKTKEGISKIAVK